MELSAKVETELNWIDKYWWSTQMHADRIRNITQGNKSKNNIIHHLVSLRNYMNKLSQ